MKLLYDFKTIDEVGGLNQSLHLSSLISIKLDVSMMDFVSTNSRPSLFEGCCGVTISTYWPKIEIAHDSTWDNFGRAYYDSRDFQFTEFHVTLCSVDELRQQIEAKMREFEQNSVVSDLCLLAEPVMPSFFERCCLQRHWNEDLYAWVNAIGTRISMLGLRISKPTLFMQETFWRQSIIPAILMTIRISTNISLPS